MGLNVTSLKANLTNPARVYLWEVDIPDAGGLAGVMASVTGLGSSRGFSSLFGGSLVTLRAQSTELPGRSVGDILIPFKQSGGLRFPGRLTYSHDWPVTFVEGEDRAIFDFLHNWEELVVGETTDASAGEPDLRRDVTLRLLDTRGNVAPQSIKMIGCYPKMTAPVPLQYGTDAPIMIPATLSYDWWEKIG